MTPLATEMSGLDRLHSAGLLRNPAALLDRVTRTHLRAEAACIALIRRSGGAALLGDRSWLDLSSGRRPPVLRFNDRGTCPICGQPRFRDGAWWPGTGRNNRANARWHTACIAAWSLWTNPLRCAPQLAEQQSFVCAETGVPLRITRTWAGTGPDGQGVEREFVYLSATEVDHRVPLWRVRAEADRHEWPDVLRFWGPGNLRVLTSEGHALKTAREAGERSALKRARKRT